MPRMASRRKTPPNVERMTSGSFRARIKAAGKTVRGSARRTAREAYEDAQDLLDRTLRRGGPETFGQAFEAVRVECKRRRRRPQTVRFYEEQAKVIEDHFGAGQRVSRITVGDVQGFVDSMLDKGNSPATVHARLRGLRRAFLVAGRKSIGLRDLIVPDVEEQDPASFMTLTETRALLHHLAEDAGDHEGDFWVTALLVLTGARKSELARMKKEDIEPDRVLIRHGKSRPRAQPLPGKRAEPLVEHLQELGDNEWVIPGQTEANRCEWLVRMSRRIRKVQPKATLHRLRAAMATALGELDPPPPPQVYGFLLGHSAKTAMGITGLYARPSPAVVRRVVERLWVAITED